MGFTTIADVEKWLGRPLCRRYSLVSFSSPFAWTKAGASMGGWPVIWALGMLANGDHEVLGVWAPQADGMLNLQALFNELANRGVERIGFVISAEANVAPLGFRSTERRCSVQPPSDVETRAALPSVSVNKAMERAAAAAAAVQASLNRIVRRQPYCEGDQTAVSAVSAAFLRLERRHGNQLPVRAQSSRSSSIWPTRQRPAGRLQWKC